MIKLRSFTFWPSFRLNRCWRYHNSYKVTILKKGKKICPAGMPCDRMAIMLGIAWYSEFGFNPPAGAPCNCMGLFWRSILHFVPLSTVHFRPPFLFSLLPSFLFQLLPNTLVSCWGPKQLLTYCILIPKLWIWYNLALFCSFSPVPP